MKNDADSREVVLPGPHKRGRNLYPIARLLIERGHPPLQMPEKHGFIPGADRMICRLGRTHSR